MCNKIKSLTCISNQYGYTTLHKVYPIVKHEQQGDGFIDDFGSFRRLGVDKPTFGTHFEINTDITVTHMQKRVVIQAHKFDRYTTSLENRMLHLTSEVGELAKGIVKLANSTSYPTPSDLEYVSKEMADVLWNVMVLADRLEINIEEAMLGKLSELDARWSRDAQVATSENPDEEYCTHNYLDGTSALALVGHRSLQCQLCNEFVSMHQMPHIFMPPLKGGNNNG